MYSNVAQNLTEIIKYEEVSTLDMMLTKAVDHSLITVDAFNLYLGAKLELYLYESVSESELKRVHKEVHEQANVELNTSFKLPRYTSYLKRLKRCAHCNALYFDLSSKNKTVTCNRNIAFDCDNKIMQRHGVILTECYREYSKARRRISSDNRSVARHREVSIESFASVMDENGNIVSNGKRRPQDESIYIPIFDSVKGIFDDTWSVKKSQKYHELDEYTRNAVKPSEVITYHISELNRES
ncbi:hypothetical protein ETI01_10685 [Macrococcoides caseolyticum]|uniref:hypothetical protein n=1 Tax=Macrococcoides caseolyticum TaxID=69966 RepID=UPI00106104BB|nr:hypothetical protein [Macrococcus caseolyticus]TDM20996.1 hypothetical protein ETI01_10685 [Macrococcus caseolyticus]